MNSKFRYIAKLQRLMTKSATMKSLAINKQIRIVSTNITSQTTCKQLPVSFFKYGAYLIITIRQKKEYIISNHDYIFFEF